MKKTDRYLILFIMSLAIAVVSLFNTQSYALKPLKTIKIGVYDSRTVVFAWSRTDLLKQYLIKLGQQNDSAQKVNDTTRLKELAVEAISFQHLLHLSVFSTGSVSSFMEVIKDKLPELAKAEGVVMIVSKWELNFRDPSIEVIDLTNKVAALFQPKENIDKMAADIAGQPPVPIQEMGIEIDMLDGYCRMFGKK